MAALKSRLKITHSSLHPSPALRAKGGEPIMGVWAAQSAAQTPSRAACLLRRAQIRVQREPHAEYSNRFLDIVYGKIPYL